MYLLLFFISVLGLIFSAHILTKGAISLAKSLGLSDFMIGTTIIAFGTSLPELSASVYAAYSNHPGIVFGDVIGSNICNIAIVGLVVFLAGGLKTKVTVDFEYLFAGTFLFFIAILDGLLTFLEAGILGLVYLIYVCFRLKDKTLISKREHIHLSSFVFVFMGVLGLFFATKYTIISLEKIALKYGIFEGVLAFVLLAIGTSLPEFITSFVAFLKKRSNLAIGNVIGSNIFNSTMVVGLSGLVKNLVVHLDFLIFQIPAMILMTLLFFFFSYDRKITQFEGFTLIFLYLIILGNI
jgi:cation:H+ antiporter